MSSWGQGSSASLARASVGLKLGSKTGLVYIYTNIYACVNLALQVLIAQLLRLLYRALDSDSLRNPAARAYLTMYAIVDSW
jgi:hypothetical protein